MSESYECNATWGAAWCKRKKVRRRSVQFTFEFALKRTVMVALKIKLLVGLAHVDCSCASIVDEIQMEEKDAKIKDLIVIV